MWQITNCIKYMVKLVMVCKQQNTGLFCACLGGLCGSGKACGRWLGDMVLACSPLLTLRSRKLQQGYRNPRLYVRVTLSGTWQTS